MKTSQKGINLLKRFEGCRLRAYKLPGEKHFTIGYGHSFDPSIAADTIWTQAQAEAALKDDLGKFEGYVNKYVPIPMTQGMFDALVSYTYNRGLGGLMTLISYSETKQEYADNMVRFWGTAVKYKDALLKRRKAERELFLSDDKTVTDIAKEVIDGKWGNGEKRKAALSKAGYDPGEVQKEVNRILKG